MNLSAFCPKSSVVLLTTLFAFSFPSQGQAGGLSIELPAEKPVFKQAPGAELVAANCLTCHSSEYISMQPPFPRTYWEGSVAKMQKVFGAPIPAEQVGAIVDYLVKNYGKENPPPTAPTTSDVPKGSPVQPVK